MFIHNVKIKTSLLLLLFIPLVMIGWLSFNILSDKYTVRQSAINLNQITILGVKISALVHEFLLE